MSNYTKSTNFATKDTLPSGNPLKIVRGTEIDTEFNNIAVAVNSKSDTLSPTFSGTVTIPTLALTNDLAIVDGGTGASTAAGVATNFATEFGNLLYPVGSIYINATNNTNPGTLLGFGTWTAFGAGRVPVGFNASDPLFDSAEETGGSKDAIVVSHNHSITDPGHTHQQTRNDTAGAQEQAITGPTTGNAYATATGNSSPISTQSATTGISINSTGSSGTNANIQPYITVFMWKRTV